MSQWRERGSAPSHDHRIRAALKLRKQLVAVRPVRLGMKRVRPHSSLVSVHGYSEIVVGSNIPKTRLMRFAMLALGASP
jgi:hypothetical protein